jgi:histidine triad (HIT) family protein
MNRCVFCRIIQGELPSKKVYEDENTLIFMDIAGDVDGHLVAVPKVHCKSLLDCPPKNLRDLMDALQRVSRHLTENCGYDGVNLLHASEESAGQSVPHLHMHLIPRKKADGIDAWPAFPGSSLPLEEVHRHITML